MNGPIWSTQHWAVVLAGCSVQIWIKTKITNSISTWQILLKVTQWTLNVATLALKLEWYLTAAVRRVTEHNPGRQRWGISLFTCQSSSGTLSSDLPISARPSWKGEAVRQIICFKGSPSLSDSPWLFLAPPITSLCFASHQSLLQPSHSIRTRRANLCSLSHARHLSCPPWMPVQSNLHLSACKAF